MVVYIVGKENSKTYIKQIQDDPVSTTTIGPGWPLAQASKTETAELRILLHQPAQIWSTRAFHDGPCKVCFQLWDS